MQRERNIARCKEAAMLLPPRLRTAAMQLTDEQMEAAEEFRLRAGCPMTVLLPTGEQALPTTVRPGELEMLCDLATEYSRYASETLRQGFLSVRGGFRVGLCGTAVVKNGENTNLKDLSSAAIRIARERQGIANELLPKLLPDGAFLDTLLLSPPGGGKTTLLRDIVRQLSTGTAFCPAMRVALIDERGEVAAMHRGEPQMDLGMRTDILDACPKAVGIPMALRCMNPQVIAVDEITVEADMKAAAMAAGCGVRLLATIHAKDLGDLESKPLYRELLKMRLFHRAVQISRMENKRRYHVEELP